MTRLRVIVLCCEGLYQDYLVKRAAEDFELVGVVRLRVPRPAGTLMDRVKRYRNPGTLLRFLQARIFLPRFERRGRALGAKLFFQNGQPPHSPAGVPQLVTANINADETANFIRSQATDIVLVNGTNLLRGPILALIPQIPLGIVNLHTGLSPYSRGGNCNLFMMIENHPELVGVTVHHIDAGIDSGDMILTAQVAMEPDDNYEMVDVRSFHQGIELMMKAVHQLASGRAHRVPQWEGGKLFLRRTGYVYEPWHRLVANRLLDAGLVRRYLDEKGRRDNGVRLVEGPGDKEA